ncbi:UNVERIFIED_CONTAM: hypothetical protein GTU68_032351, partial [Idotea baltica]|nr:hypothetical protein [Idotea baltica]
HTSWDAWFLLLTSDLFFRAHVERGGGAWCPRAMIDNLGKEHLEVNLGSLHILTKVEVQGRFGNGQGKEYAEKYKLQYWREGLGHWITYRNGRGEEVSSMGIKGRRGQFYGGMRVRGREGGKGEKRSVLWGNRGKEKRLVLWGEGRRG